MPLWGRRSNCRTQYIEAQCGDDHAQRSTRERQQQAFDEEASSQVPSRGAQRGAHDEIAMTRTEPDQHEVRQVDARDEHDEAHRAQQHQHPGPDAAREICVQWLNLGHSVLEPARSFRLEASRDLIHRGLSLNQ